MERLQSEGKKQAVQATGQNKTSQNDTPQKSYVASCTASLFDAPQP